MLTSASQSGLAADATFVDVVAIDFLTSRTQMVEHVEVDECSVVEVRVPLSLLQSVQKPA